MPAATARKLAPPKSSPERLAASLALLIEASKKHAEQPERLHEVADRIAFRITDTDELFTFLPSTCRGGLPMGGGTIWGLICESPSLVAGVLIRRLFVERLGHDFSLTEGQADQTIWVLHEEHPQNAGLLELVSRCAPAREKYAERGLLWHSLSSLQEARKLLAAAPAGRVATDIGCMGTTSALYGMKDADAAIFTEADLVRCNLELLLSAECQAWPAAAARQGGAAAEALREVAVLVAELGATLCAQPAVNARIYAFLSGIIPQAFAVLAEGDASAGRDFWILMDVLASSAFGDFAEAVLEVAALNRLSKADEVEQAREVLFLNRRPDGDGGRLGFGQGPPPDAARLALCHVILLFLRICHLSGYHGGQPQAFCERALKALRDRFLQRFRRALEGIACTTWPELREVVAALVMALERLPTPSVEQDWLRVAEAAFIKFAVTRFLRVGGLVTEEVAQAWLDLFNSSAALALAKTAKVAGTREAWSEFVRWSVKVFDDDHWQWGHGKRTAHSKDLGARRTHTKAPQPTETRLNRRSMMLQEGVVS